MDEVGDVVDCFCPDGGSLFGFVANGDDVVLDEVLGQFYWLVESMSMAHLEVKVEKKLVLYAHVANRTAIEGLQFGFVEEVIGFSQMGDYPQIASILGEVREDGFECGAVDDRDEVGFGCRCVLFFLNHGVYVINVVVVVCRERCI